MATSTNLETIPGQRGSLVIAEDGAVIHSTGELQNDERTALIMLNMMKTSLKMVKSVNGERNKSNVQRLCVSYKNYSLVASVWNHRIYVVKRINPDK